MNETIHRFYCADNLNDLSESEAVNTLQELSSTTVPEILDILTEDFEPYQIVTGDIPQYSKLADIFRVPILLHQSGMEEVNFKTLGYLLEPVEKKEDAHKKYGENHGKMAAMFGLCTIRNSVSRVKLVSLNEVGKCFFSLPKEEQEQLKPRLALRCKILQNYFIQGCPSDLCEGYLNMLKESTRIRRRHNLMCVLSMVNNEYENGL